MMPTHTTNPFRLKFPLRFLAILVLLLATLSVFATARAQLASDMVTTEEGREEVFEALVDLFKDNYWDEDFLDWDEWADDFRDRALRAKDRDAFERILTRMVNELDDEHSNFIGYVPDVGNSFVAPEPPSRVGIGIEYDYFDKKGIVISRVLPTTPAEVAGLRRGDVVININGEDITDVSRGKATGLVRDSSQDEEVKVKVLRQNEQLDIVIEPGPIRFGEVRDLARAYMIEKEIGYIYIPTFNETGVGQRVHNLIGELQEQGATSLIMDLRDNPGGILSELGLVLGIFTQGKWAQAISRSELAWISRYEILETQLGEGERLLRGRQYLETPEGETINVATVQNPVEFNGPVSILVTQQNSSAGEIAPLVLKDLKGATVIGEITNGNVESIRGFDLPDGSVVLIAMANMESSTGGSFNKGVMPDTFATASIEDLARGYDEPVAEALKALQELPFTPRKFF